jgi:cellulose synthase/poly-beta-1,6-N-acetylglucosamine synthase-like glycosyltransferase
MTTHVLWVLVHSLALVVFINRYLAGVILRMVRGRKWDETREWEPSVTAVIPMFNEGATIKETLRSILDSDYPHAKLKIICVDDCSTDDSFDQAREIARGSNGRLRVLRNPHNVGKRRSIIRAVREAECDVILSVDSDVVIDTGAVRQLVRRFTSDRIAAVGGWVDVRNKQDNWLTRMQVVRYWYAYNFMKNLEWGFRRVMCLSGCLTAYRRSVLMELEPVLEHRAICGVPIKYGEDRFLTRQIIKAGYLTTMTLSARCRTTVPTTLSSYFSQQLRWRRSNTIDYVGGFTHVWRLNPIIAIHYFSLFALQFAYPLAIVRALASHKFYAALEIHLMIIAVFGVYYRWRARHEPREERVGALSFASLAILMPVGITLLAPLALFTLDSGSWETRGVPEVAVGETSAVADVASGPILVPAMAAEGRKRVGRGTGSQSELPAA